MKRDILITGAGGFIGSRIPGGKKFKGDIMSPFDVLASTRGISGIVHLAAVSNRQACEENPRGCIRINLLSLCNVLEQALRRNLWVLFISTFQVRDRSLYGLSKLMGEELCREYQKQGLRVKILRLPIVYGPGDKAHKVVTRIISQIEQGVEPKIETRKKFYFLYVDDAVKVIEKEVDVLSCRPGRKISLHTLEAGIRKCLSGRKRKAKK